MGAIADRLRATLEEIKQRDAESRARTEEALARIRDLVERLQALDFSDVDRDE